MLAGATRGKGGRGLSRHLTSTTSGQVVRILENRHLDSVNVRDALRELVAGSAHGRTDRPVHHVHVDPPIGAESEALFDRWCELYEQEFGLQDAPRIAVEHEKKGRRHRHYVYSLVDDNGRVVDLSWEKARREKISRIIEHEFGLPFVPGKHNKAVIKALRAEGRADVAAAMETASLHKVARPSAITPEQRHQAERTGVAPKDIGARALMAWKSSDTDTALEAASAAVNVRYAIGDKGPVIVDETGAVTLATRLLGAASKAVGERIPAAVIKARLAGLHLPPLEEVRRAIREAAKQPADGQEASAGVEVPQPEKLVQKPPQTDLDRQRMIWTEAKGAHQVAKQVLQLLDPSTAAEEGQNPPDPLEDVKALLVQIVESLSAQQQQLDSLEAHVVAIREGRGRFGKHSGSPQ